LQTSGNVDGSTAQSNQHNATSLRLFLFIRIIEDEDNNIIDVKDDSLLRETTYKYMHTTRVKYATHIEYPGVTSCKEQYYTLVRHMHALSKEIEHMYKLNTYLQS